ncbi:nucleic-acid-binding protein from transposon X-element [Nephila pilipes]|uniref:Nucleic-acid-binding protein from transposon X-element n=1 Tax=Nephila pilipes TaxID=299642 RepID=A0A8X6TIG8_NEPPI|nr:nucleic-acid-binding protein from transposon X-element [Nephila pilipes]
MQQHIKSKNDEVQILKERLVALEILVTTNSEKLVATNSEIQKTATTKINKIKRTKKRREKKKSKTNDKFALQTLVELTNKFSALEVEEKIETLEIEEFPEIQNEKVISPTNENREETDEPTLVEKQKQKRVPPIMIDESLNTPALLDEISAIVGAKIQARVTNGKLKVFPESIDAHRKIQNFISVKKLKSHTFEMQNQKQLKVTIRGLPINYNQEEIIEEIKNQGSIPKHISLLKSRRANTNMPLFLVVLNKNPVNQDIYNIEHIGYFRVKIESLKKNTMPPQCYRCQQFYHHSRFCNREPKCLKCGQKHLTKDCQKSSKTPPKCALCERPHPANYSGCPNNPQNYKPKPVKNV